MLVILFRALSDQALVNVGDLPQPFVTSRCLRSSDQSLLAVPHSRLKTRRDCAFELAAPLLKSSPIEFKICESMEAFKNQLKTLCSD